MVGKAICTTYPNKSTEYTSSSLLVFPSAAYRIVRGRCLRLARKALVVSERPANGPPTQVTSDLTRRCYPPSSDQQQVTSTVANSTRMLQHYTGAPADGTEVGCILTNLATTCNNTSQLSTMTRRFMRTLRRMSAKPRLKHPRPADISKTYTISIAWLDRSKRCHIQQLFRITLIIRSLIQRSTQNSWAPTIPM